MWTKSYSTTVKGTDIDRLWQVWSDVDAWQTWQSDLDYAKLEGAFATGSTDPDASIWNRTSTAASVGSTDTTAVTYRDAQGDNGAAGIVTVRLAGVTPISVIETIPLRGPTEPETIPGYYAVMAPRR